MRLGADLETARVEDPAATMATQVDRSCRSA